MATNNQSFSLNSQNKMGPFSVYRYLRPSQIILRPDSFCFGPNQQLELSKITVDYDPLRGIAFRFDVDPEQKVLRFCYEVCDGNNFNTKTGRERVDEKFQNGDGYEIQYEPSLPLVVNVIYFVTSLIASDFADVKNPDAMREFAKHLEHCVYTNQFPEIKVVR
ncbi:hypothetical protein RsoM2USA_471 [Ralstonia phage RsoM2USA]|nr:hypothetical protein RsoM2USA_471 [Ralstonia phage RsoM2USA]